MMSADTQKIACPKCGTRNRVSLLTSGKPRCAKCHSDLPWLSEATTDNFDSIVDSSSLPVLVDLWAPWCGPCKVLGPALESFARERAGSVRVLKVNVDNEPNISSRLKVKGIPTMVLYRDGTEISRQVGAIPANQIARWVDKSLS